MNQFSLYLLLVLLPIFVLGQKAPDTANERTFKKRSVKLDSTKLVLYKPDTVMVALKDSSAVVIPTFVDSIRIVLVKNEEDKDNAFYKYWFPLITLAVGAALALLAEWVRRWFAIRKAGRRWIGLAKIYIPAIKSQEEEIKKFLAEENADKYEMTALNRISSIDGEQFGAYSKEDLLSYLETHKRMPADVALRNLANFTGTLSALKFNYQQLDNSYKLYETAISRYAAEATDVLRNIGAALADWTRAIEIRGPLPGENIPYQAATELYHNEVHKSQKGDTAWNIFELEAKLYDPMIEILAPGFTIPEVYKVLKAIEIAKYAIPRVKAEKKYMIQNADTLLIRYEEYRKELAENIDAIALSDHRND